MQVGSIPHAVIGATGTFVGVPPYLGAIAAVGIDLRCSLQILYSALGALPAGQTSCLSMCRKYTEPTIDICSYTHTHICLQGNARFFFFFVPCVFCWACIVSCFVLRAFSKTQEHVSK